jgi:signal transduction histidine kinase/HAMP domain-containing protein
VSLRVKLLLPLMVTTALIAVGLYALWMPRALVDAEAEYLDLVDAHLQTAAESLVPLLLASELDSVHQNLEVLQSENRDWVAVRLIDARQRPIYPLREPVSSATAPKSPRVRPLVKDVTLLGVVLARLEVDVDPADRIARNREKIGRVARSVLGVLVLMLLAAVVVLELAVRGPVTQLAAAARGLARQDFTTALPAVSGDEVGEMVSSFALMRDQLRQFQSELHREINVRRSAEEELRILNRGLEERVRERTVELSQRNSDLQGVFDAVRQGLLTIDREGRVVGEVSAMALHWFGAIAEGGGWEEVLARTDARYARSFALAFAKVMEGREPLAALLAQVPRRLSARERSLDLELRPVGCEEDWTRLLVVVSDATDEERQRQLEVELRHAQKLQAVGQLAAGIAHEINTPSQFVGDSVAFLEGSFRDLSALLSKYREALGALERGASLAAVRQDVSSAEEAADLGFVAENAPAAFERAMDGISRISTLVRAMKEFAHPDRREKAPADLNRALQATLTIATNEIKQVAEVETDLGMLPPVPCHLSDLNQVLLNLLVNAAHAIGEVVAKTGGKGRIRVRTAHEGDWVRIVIEDTGCGIPDEIQDRIFDPFFTTKEVGKGTGQGLAIARSIVVEKHGGSLGFESEVGKGTTFTIVLPVSEAPCGKPS